MEGKINDKQLNYAKQIPNLKCVQQPLYIFTNVNYSMAHDLNVQAAVLCFGLVHTLRFQRSQVKDKKKIITCTTTFHNTLGCY